MSLWSGPQALVEHIATTWQPARTGREDVPDVVRDGSGNALYGEAASGDGFGVLVAEDRQVVKNQYSVNDLIHCYHPEADGVLLEDIGYDEKNVIEGIQVDIETTDRTDQDTGERLSARDRLVGNRDDAGFSATADPPYPGVAGECFYVIESVRRHFKEWDVARLGVVDQHLGNSNAHVSLSVDLEHIASPTV